jgi:DNA-binding transcriptional regulator LsrR (DeoR family)
MARAADEYYEAAMKDVDVVIAGLGAIETCWVLDGRERARLARKLGAIGDILYDLYGEQGTPIKVKPAAAVFPFGIGRLRQMVAGGKEVIVISTGKTLATYHALSCRQDRFVTGIVTDERTARSILDLRDNMA